MTTKRKAEGGRGRGAHADLINYDHKNELNPLKQEVHIRKAGGLFLASNGVKVEVIPGAPSSRKERLVCAALPTSVRAMFGPWLGPNLRMASDMQMIYSPQNFRAPVAVFIPFSCAAARELSLSNEAEESTVQDTEEVKGDSVIKDNKDGDSVQADEMTTNRRMKASFKLRQPSLQLGKSAGEGPTLLDTRSVFLLCCRLGDDQWDLVENFTVIQPTVHHTNWPNELKRLTAQSTRWHDSCVTVSNTGQSTASTDINYQSKTRLNGMSPRTKRALSTSAKELDHVEQIRRIENYCGGLFIATEELHHLYAIVIGARAENVTVNRNGAFIRSSLLHPFLSVRIPKRSCLMSQTASFKTVELRPNWSSAATQFDSQMGEVDGCSDIYELDLHDVTLSRPAIVRLPLPQWFIERHVRSHENWEQTSVTVNSLDPQDPSTPVHSGKADGTYNYDRPLMLLYQPPGSQRQIVWQSAIVEDARDDMGRRKSRFQTPRKDNANSSRCRIENLYCRLGWTYLLVGLRGGQWYTMKQPLHFTKRTAFFETSVLGRFVLIAARDPDRTPVTKLAHLMSRVEALAVAPPGALVIFLQLQPTCWKIKAKMVPEERLTETIKEHVSAGYIPIVQMAPGPRRRSIGLCNSIIQATDIIQMFREAPDTQKMRQPPPVRVNGADINHVLMYNGLCLEFRLTGDVRQKPVSQFEPLGQVLKGSKQQPQQNEVDVDTDGALSAIGKTTISLDEFIDPKPRRNVLTMLSSSAFLQQNELLSENSCVFEIEPILPDDENASETNKFLQKSFEKLQLVKDGLRASLKKHDQDTDEFDDDEEESDLLNSEDDGLRQSFGSYEPAPPSAYDGNDGAVDEFTQEAQEQVLAGQPLSVNTINSELLRRLNNVIEKSRFNRAGDFLQKVHDMFHIGTLEVWLVSPESVPQLVPPKSEQPDTRESVASPQVPSDIPTQSAEVETGSVRSLRETQPEEIEDEEHEDGGDSVQEAHNATKWKPNEANQKSDVLTNPTKPLAVYNLLIDPDLVLGYNRSPIGKSGNSIVMQNKTGRTKWQRGKQNNASTNRGNKSKSPSSLKASTSPEIRITNGDVAARVPELTQKMMRAIATHVRDVHGLAVTLGMSDAEFVDIIQNNTNKPSSDLAFDVLNKWKLQNSRKTTEGKNDMTPNDKVLSEQPAENIYQELMAALESIGCHDGVKAMNVMSQNGGQS